MRRGYKITEVGIIPEDWEVKRLGELGAIVRGGSPRPAGDPRYFNGNYIPWLTVAALTNIAEHVLEVTNTVGFLTEEGSKYSRTLPGGTLIIANSGATLGVAKILGVTCCANDGIAAIANQKAGEKLFICYCINTQTKTLRDVVATGNGQPNLNTRLIGDIAIPYPPVAEQRAIAAALRDIDALLGGLERLVTKKHDLKQAAMQQLLTGKRRLPGFGGEWEWGAIGNVVEVLEAGVSVNSTDDTPSPETPCVLKTSALSHGAFLPGEAKCIAPQDRFRARINPTRRSILISRMNTPELVGEVAYVDDDYPWLFLPDRVWITRFRTASKLNVRWLAYLLSSRIYRTLLKGVATGTSGSMKNISKDALLNLPVRFPTEVEQSAIAEVLSDMDGELSVLEARCKKTRALKQAMMRELLPGRTRLL